MSPMYKNLGHVKKYNGYMYVVLIHMYSFIILENVTQHLRYKKKRVSRLVGDVHKFSSCF